MFEKVNPAHPDKVADRVAGAIVDYAYTLTDNPHIAVEVLIGHGVGHVIIESDVDLFKNNVCSIFRRIAGDDLYFDYALYPQDKHLNDNQSGAIRCGDNGIFKGVPVTFEQEKLTAISRFFYETYNSDGKYILNGDNLIVCQSNAETEKIKEKIASWGCYNAVVNPLGEWTGGTNVDCGATNRKLGSDMGDSVTGGGLHGKDLSKADVSVNIYAWLKAQDTGLPVELYCAIGDETVDGKPYAEIVEIARQYIKNVGGFEKFAEWGLIQ